MAYRDCYSSFEFFHALDTVAIAATTNGRDCDLQGFEGATMVVALGRCSYVSTASYWKLRLQHTDASALGAGPSDYADVASVDLIRFSGAVTSGIWKNITNAVAGSDSTQGSVTYAIGYCGNKRYIRLVAEIVSTPSVLNIGVTCLKGIPADWPVSYTDPSA